MINDAIYRWGNMYKQPGGGGDIGWSRTSDVHKVIIHKVTLSGHSVSVAATKYCSIELGRCRVRFTASISLSTRPIQTNPAARPPMHDNRFPHFFPDETSIVDLPPDNAVPFLNLDGVRDMCMCL